MASPPQDASLEAMITKFSSKDFIMDPRILEHLRSFLAAGGNPQDAISLLSDNYRGFASMCNVVGEWLSDLGMDKTEVDSLASTNIQKLIQSHFKSQVADSILESLIQGGKGPPAWLFFMIERAPWRQLVYQLSEEHQDCLTLNFAIERIADAGHHKEMPQLSCLGNLFRVFNRVLAGHLSDLTRLSADAIPQAMDTLKKMCCRTPHTYIYAQSILQKCAQDALTQGHVTASALFRRVSQELEAHAATLNASFSRKLSVLLSSDALAFHDVSAALQNMLASASTNPSDIITLCNYYTRPEPPPLELLQHPDLFELIVQELFTPHCQVQMEYMDRYVQLLAIACTPYSSSHASSSSGQPEKAIDEDMRRKEELSNAITQTSKLCQNRASVFHTQASVLELRPTVKHYPIIAVGALNWMRVGLTDPELVHTVYTTKNLTSILLLMKEIAFEHPMLHDHVLRVVQEVLGADLKLDDIKTVDLRRGFVDVLVYVFQRGSCLSVIQFVSANASRLDQSLLRYFFIQSIESIASDSPLSPQLLRSLCDLLCMPRMYEALEVAISSFALQSFLRRVIPMAEEAKLNPSIIQQLTKLKPGEKAASSTPSS